MLVCMAVWSRRSNRSGLYVFRPVGFVAVCSHVVCWMWWWWLMGRWSDDCAWWVVHYVRLYSVLDTVVTSGEDVCCSVVFGTLVGVSVFSVIWSELLMTSPISCPQWSSVYPDHLKFCVVCINGRRYVCCSKWNVVSNECNEPTTWLVQPIGAQGGKVVYFENFCRRSELGFLNCDDICTCVVSSSVLDFVLIPFMLTCSIMRFISRLLQGTCAWVVCAVIWMSLVCLWCWYPVWWVWGVSIRVVHVVQLLCLMKMTC